MDTAELLLKIEAKIEVLQEIANLLRESKPPKPGKGKASTRKPMSPEARAKIGAAQRKRWAAVAAAKKKKKG